MPTDTPATPALILDDHQARAETSLSTQAAEVTLLTTDKGLTRSRSLPQEATTPLASPNEDCSAQPEPEGGPTQQQQQPKSPPPNSLWNTPRASDRCRSMSYGLSPYLETALVVRVSSNLGGVRPCF